MRGEPTTAELQALAARQQHQLDTQARLIAAREHRLRQVQEGVQNDQVIGGGEAERLRKLRERVEAQEAKLRKLRALRGQTDQQRITNGSLSADLTSIRALFNEKEKELSMAAAQVEELTRQLDQFQQQASLGNGSYYQQAHPGSKAYFVQLHLERLRAELMYRNKLNEQKSTELREKKSRLLGNRDKLSECEGRIVELRDRLQRKKQLNQQLAVQLSEKSTVAAASASGRNNRPGVQPGAQLQHQQVAAVEPFNRSNSTSRDTFDDVTDFTASKSDLKYQTLPYNTRFLPSSFLNHNNNNNRSSPIMMSGGSKGGLKVASVPPQTVQADRPALPPKPLPTIQFKPLLPPRQTVAPQQAGTSSPIGEVPASASPQPTTADGWQKAELPLKPKSTSGLKKHTVPPPPPPPLPPSHPPVLLPDNQEDETQQHTRGDEDIKATDEDRMDITESQPVLQPSRGNLLQDGRDKEDMQLHPDDVPSSLPPVSSLDDEDAEAMDRAPPSPPPSLPEEYVLDDEDLDHPSSHEMAHVGGDSLNDPTAIPQQHEGAARRLLKKGNLKAAGPVDALRKSRRVSFDPLALLLDASLEGELELVKKTALEVPNPSAANDEGITALHNAICAGHLDIVRFLVQLGCDVNAQDSDGWTPLHCAASCNNLAMVRFLVEHGACIFAATLSDQETAAEKCEEDEEGFDGCSEYLYSIQEKLGILNGGRVSAVYDYEAQNPDELSFSDGDELVVLRKGDDFEREWWWSRLNDHEGYVPRNLLGLYPRIKRKEPEE